MRRAWLLLLGALACRAAPPADPMAGLDREGRAMLSPVRARQLPPDRLLAALGLRGDETVADVGAGPGYLTLPLAQALPRGRVIATDINASYLAALTRRAAGVRNIETVVVAKDDPGLAPGSVDLALVVQVDHYLGDRADYFRKLRGALRPNGRIALVNFDRYRAPDLAAAQASGLAVSSSGDAGPGLFLVILKAAAP